MKDTRQKIIDLAEEAIATKGYSSFSFRELAAGLGIKSASVHYHFPTKAHLGLAVVQSYRAVYSAALAAMTEANQTPEDTLAALVDLYRQQMLTSQRMSVCMMLAAEINSLPEEIQVEMRRFYQLNLDWLTQLSAHRAMNSHRQQMQQKASQAFALLQGAMMGAKTQNDPAYFDRAVSAMGQILFG